MEMPLAITIHSKIQELSASSDKQSPRILFISLIRDLAKRLDTPAYRVFAQQIRPIAEEFGEHFLEKDDREAAHTIATALDDVRRGKKAAVGKVLVAWLWRNFPAKGDEFLEGIGYQLVEGRLVEQAVQSDPPSPEPRSPEPAPETQLAPLHRVQIDFWATVKTADILSPPLARLDVGNSRPNKWCSFAYEKKPGDEDTDQDAGAYKFSRKKFSNWSPVYVNNGRGVATQLIDREGNHVARLEDYAHGYRWGCFFVDGESTLTTLFNDFHKRGPNDQYGGTILLSRRKPPKRFSNDEPAWGESSKFRVSRYAVDAIAFRGDTKDRRIIYLDKVMILVVDGISETEILRIEIDEKTESFLQVCFHKNQNFIAVSGLTNAKYDSYVENWRMDYRVFIYDIALGELVHEFAVSEDVAKNGFRWSAFVPNQRVLAYLDGTELVFYDFEKADELDRIPLSIYAPKFVSDSELSSLEYSPESGFLRIQTGEEQHIFKLKFEDNLSDIQLNCRNSNVDENVQEILELIASGLYENSAEALSHVIAKDVDVNDEIRALFYLGAFGSYALSLRAIEKIETEIERQNASGLGAELGLHVKALILIYVLCSFSDFKYAKSAVDHFNCAKPTFLENQATVTVMEYLVSEVHKFAGMAPPDLGHD